MVKADKGLFVSLAANHADGLPLLNLALEGGCTFDPASGQGPLCRMTLRDTHIDTPMFSGPAKGYVLLELSPGKLLLRELSMTMRHARLSLGRGHEQFVNLTLTGSGEYLPARGEWRLDKATLTTDAGLALSGFLSMSPQGFAARFALNLHDPVKLAAALGSALVDAAWGNLPAGPVVLDLSAEGGPDAFGPLGLNVTTTATLREGVRLSGVDVPPLRLSARPKFDGEGWLLRNLVVSALGVSLGGEMRLDNAGGLRADLSGRGLRLESIAPTAQRMTGLPFADWAAAGGLDVAANIIFTKGRLSASADLSLHDAAYMSPMADYMAQGLSARLKLTSNQTAAQGHRGGHKVRASLEVPGGEVLFGAAYLSLAKHPLAASGAAVQTGQSRYEDITATLDWKGLGQAEAAGELTATGPLAQWQCRAELAASEVDLGRWFDIGADAMALKNFQGDAGVEGQAALDLFLDADGENASLSGQLTIDGGSLTAKDDSLEVRGVELRLPVSYRLRGPVVNLSPQYVSPKQWGSVRAGLVRVPGVLLSDAATQLALVPNRLFIREKVDLSVLGGMVRLSSLQCDQPFSERMEVRAGVRLRGLDLAELTTGAFPLQGSLEGNLGTVRLSRKALVVPGTARGSFFGGEALVEAIHVDDPFRRHRRVGFSVSVREMDLERLSTAMDVGRVTGRMDLDLHDVLLAYGQPVGMLLRAETSGEGDFEKSVSIKAVNSLSVIGTGSGIGDLGVGLFAGFFEEFSYDRIGFQCVLNNDIFRVRGLVRDGGVEYLIKKPFLTGINVVNSNPNNNISFKDMLERVRRVLGEKPRSVPGA